MTDIYLILLIILLLIGIICQIVIGALYQNLIREAEDMSFSENGLLRTCKTKFSASYQMNKGITNVPVFVDKFINRMHIGRFKVSTLVHFSGQVVLLSALVAGIGIYRGIVAGHNILDLLPYYIASFLGMYLFFAVSGIVNIQEKKNVLKTNMVDYLENVLLLKLVTKTKQKDSEEKETSRRENATSRNDRKQIEEFPYWKNSKEIKELGELLMDYLV